MPRRGGRLSRSADFERAYRQGRSHGNRYLVLYVFSGSGSEEPRLGVSVGRKVGGAVDRNRVKRLLREAFAARAAGLTTGSDYVVVARAEARDLAQRDGLEGIDRALGELLAAGAAEGVA